MTVLILKHHTMTVLHFNNSTIFPNSYFTLLVVTVLHCSYSHITHSHMNLANIPSWTHRSTLFERHHLILVNILVYFYILNLYKKFNNIFNKLLHEYIQWNYIQKKCSTQISSIIFKIWANNIKIYNKNAGSYIWKLKYREMHKKHKPL